MYKPKVCKQCGIVIKPISGRQLYCLECRKHIHYKNSYKYMCKTRFKQPGIGSGNYNHSKRREINHPLFRTGEYVYERLREEVRKRDNYTCQMCNKDLTNINNNYRHVHHIDHNRLNYKIENLILLCISCHMRHHKKGSETISKEST